MFAIDRDEIDALTDLKQSNMSYVIVGSMEGDQGFGGITCVGWRYVAPN